MYYRLLLTDDEFKSLDIPLTTDQYVSLDYQIKKGLCREPVVIWHDYILEGHQRYDLYQKYHVPFNVEMQYMANRYLAAAWCCRKQLTRTDLTANAEAWLLYRLFNIEQKIAQREKARDFFQYRQLSPSKRAGTDECTKSTDVTVIQERICEEYKISLATLRRYIIYGKSLDQLEKIVPTVRKRVLTGDLEVARVHVPDLLKMPRQDLQEKVDNPRCHKLEVPRPEKPLKYVPKKSRQSHNNIKLSTGIKEMPKYDPDAELNGLAFTVSAWKNAVSRAIEKTDFDHATIGGRAKLHGALEGLLEEINKLSSMVEVHFDD